MFYLLSSGDNIRKYSVMDTEDGVVEDVSKDELIHILRDLKIPIVGVSYSNGSVETKVPNEPDARDIEHMVWRDHIIVCFVTKGGRWTYDAHVRFYNHKKGNYGGEIRYPNIEYYPWCSIFTRSEDADECNVTIGYHDKHYYREDHGEDFSLPIKLTYNNGKLKIDKGKFRPTEY